MVSPPQIGRIHLSTMFKFWGPPLIDVEGKASVYRQFKCISLDIPLDTADIARWKEIYRSSLENRLKDLKEDAIAGTWEGTAERIKTLEWELSFLDRSYAQDLVELRVEILMARRDPKELLAFLETVEKESISIVALGRVLEFARESGLGNDLAVRILRATMDSWDGIPDDAEEAEQIRILLIETDVERGDVDPTEIGQVAAQLSGSRRGSVGAFGRLWSALCSTFQAWRSGWRFLFGDNGPIHFVRSQGPDGGPVVQKVVSHVGDARAEEPLVSEVESKPGSFSVEYRLREAELPDKRRTDGHALQEVYTRFQEALSRAKEQRAAGEIPAVVGAIEQAAAQALKAPAFLNLEDLFRLDADPEIRRYRLQQWLQGLTPAEFERETARLLVLLGWSAFATRMSGDGGVDVRGEKDGRRLVAQCKHWHAAVGKEPIKAIKVTADDEGAEALIVTTGKVQPGARKWAETHGVHIIDGSTFVRLLSENFLPGGWGGDEGKFSATSVPAGGGNEDVSLSRGSDWEEGRTSIASGQSGEGSDHGPPADVTDDDSRGWDELIQETIISLLESQAYVRNADIQAKCGCTREEARAALAELCALGLLVKEGKTRGTRYFLSPRRSSRQTPLTEVNSTRLGRTSGQELSGVAKRASGVIEYWNGRKHFGKIIADIEGGIRAHVHVSDLVERLDELFLVQGQSVTCDLVNGERGIKAENVRVVLDADVRRLASSDREGIIIAVNPSECFVRDEVTELSFYAGQRSWPKDVKRALESGM